MIVARVKTKGGVSLQTIANCFELKRDAYYKNKKRTDKRLESEKQLIEIIKKRRESLPREGVRNKYRRFRRKHWFYAYKWLQETAKHYPNLFVHWQYGFKP